MSEETIDWKKLSAVNLNEIKNTKNHPAIQENLSNILNCNPIGEFNMSHVDPNFHKLFRLSQLTIKSLMESQSYLSGVIVAMGDKLKSSQEREKTKEGQVQEALERAGRYKKKCMVLNKMMQVQQQMLSQNKNGEAHCQFCPKRFVSLDFLANHMKRRHPEDLQKFNPNLLLSDKNFGVAASRTVQQDLGDIRTKMDSEVTCQRKENVYELLSHLKSDILKKVEEKFSGDDLSKELQLKLESLKSSFDSELKGLSENQNKIIKRVESLSNFQKVPEGNIGELEAEPNEEILKRLSEDYEEKIRSKEAQMAEAVDENSKLWEAKLNKQERDHEIRIEELVSIISELRVQIQRLESTDRKVVIDHLNRQVKTNANKTPKEVSPPREQPMTLKSPPLVKGIEFYRRRSLMCLNKELMGIGIDPNSTHLSEADYVVSMDKLQSRTRNRLVGACCPSFVDCRQNLMVELDRRMAVSSSSI